jgi:hypothetical protein
MWGDSIQRRIVEAYIGEYASGKSEVAVNRAIELQKEGRLVTLADLDLVEPFYTLRPIKKKLTDLGIGVVAWETSETLGLGEAGSIIKPEMRWVLRRPGDIILDIGYGVEGAKILNLVEGALTDEDLRVFVVINIGRPLTFTIEEVIEYVGELGPVHGLINNSHLGDETTLDFVEKGACVVTEAAKVLGLPVVASYVDQRLSGQMKPSIMGIPVRFLHRYMIDAFW